MQRLLLAVALLAPMTGGGKAFAEPIGAAPPAMKPADNIASVDKGSLGLFAVELDRITLTESFGGYGDPADPLVPVGELARLLDLDIMVRVAERSITGRIGESGKPLTVDLARSLASIGGVEVAIGPDDVAVSAIDIFIRASVLQRLLPIKISSDADDYRLILQATEKLPIQARTERRERGYTLGAAPQPEKDVLQVTSRARWLGLPGFDFITEMGYDKGRGGFQRRFEGRVAGDVLKSNFNGYLATDDRGNPAGARLSLEKRAYDGSMAGGLHASFIGVGDVFTPSMSLGPRSISGAGFALSTARTEDTNVFQRISLRGELPIGFDVELYINDILYAGQNEATQGRYEFLNVPLVRGINIIRIVTYGQRGQRQEVTQVVNIGGGQLAAGKTVIDVGAVAQDRPLIEFPDGAITESLAAKGRLRMAANIAHGLTTGLTVTGGLGIFTDQLGASHQVISAGGRGSLFGSSMQLDVAKDLQGGSAILLGAAGRLKGLSYLARHSEYLGIFLDENVSDFDPVRPLVRHSELLIDFAAPFPGGKRLPLSGRIEMSQFADGGTIWSTRGRTSLLVANTLVAVGADYSRRKSAGFSDERLTANFSLSRLINYNWQLRASSDIDILPRASLRSLSATLDHPIAPWASWRIGLAKSFGVVQDFSAQSGLVARLPFGDAALSGDYSTQQRRWRIGLQLSFGFVHDPSRGGYRLTPPGPANGGSAAIRAFTDDNLNGRMDADEAPVPGIAIQGGPRTVTTDAHGRAFVTGLGNGRPVTLRAETGDVDTLFTSAPPVNIGFVPRAGVVTDILYPFTPASEVVVQARFRKADGAQTGLSAVRLRIVDDSGQALEAATEFDGTAVFEAVKPGTYRLEIEAEQAHRIGIALKQPVSFTVNLKGRQIDVNSEIILVQPTAQ